AVAAGPRVRVGRGRGAAPVVLDLEVERRGAPAHDDRDLRVGARVLEHVRQGLLAHAVHGEPRAGRELPRVATRTKDTRRPLSRTCATRDSRSAVSGCGARSSAAVAPLAGPDAGGP